MVTVKDHFPQGGNEFVDNVILSQDRMTLWKNIPFENYRVFQTHWDSLPPILLLWDLAIPRRREEIIKHIPQLYSLLATLGLDGRSIGWHDLVEKDNQPHDESLVVARPHYQIKHVSSQRYI